MFKELKKDMILIGEWIKTGGVPQGGSVGMISSEGLGCKGWGKGELQRDLGRAASPLSRITGVSEERVRQKQNKYLKL